MFCNHTTLADLVNKNIHEAIFYHEFDDLTEEIIEGHRTVLTIPPREERKTEWYDDISDITDEDYFRYFNDDNSISDESSASSSSVSTWDEIDRLQCLFPLGDGKRRTSVTTEVSMSAYFNENISPPRVESFPIIDISNKDQSNLEFTNRHHKCFTQPEIPIKLPSEVLQESQSGRQVAYEPVTMISCSGNIENKRSGNSISNPFRPTCNSLSSPSAAHQSLNAHNQDKQPTSDTARALSSFSFRSLISRRSSIQNDAATTRYMLQHKNYCHGSSVPSHESTQESLISMRTTPVSSCKPRQRSLWTIIKSNHSKSLKFMRQVMPETVTNNVREIV